MADSNGHHFIITEQNNQGTFEVSTLYAGNPVTPGSDINNSGPIRFVWTVEGRSKPRESWKTHIHMRTVRTEYSNLPTEQLLGPKFENFTLSGVWDNKYNGGSDTDFAERQRTAMESLVRRGSLCRFDFDDISIVGLIIDFKPEYFRRSRIGYSITVSPHYNAQEQGERKVPATAPSTNQTDKTVAKIIQDAKNRHAQGPQAYMIKGVITSIIGPANIAQVAGQSLYDQVSKYVNLLDNSSRSLHSIIASRNINFYSLGGQKGQPYGGPTSATSQQASSRNNGMANVQRLISQLSAMKAYAVQLKEYLKTRTAANDLIYQDGAVILSYQSWTRGLEASMRLLILACDDGITQFAKYIKADALAVYRPQFQESLYAISTKFYGTPTNWQRIYTQNNLKALTLDGTELLVIPKV